MITQRSWKVAAIGGWLLVGMAMASGAGKRDELRVGRLVIEDLKGETRIAMSVINGGPLISLYDEAGNVKIRLAVPYSGQGEQIFYGESHGPRLGLGVNVEDNGAITGRDNKGAKRFGMGVNLGTDNAVMGVINEDGESIIGLAK